MKWYYVLSSLLTGQNSKNTPPDMIADQLNEPRPLPMGKTEFYVWSDRIIAGSLVPNEDGFCVYHDEDKCTPEQLERLQVFKDSQIFALANCLFHLGPTESHKPDAFFIHSLRKFAVNQIADAVRIEVRDQAKARIAEQAAKKAADEAKQGSV